MCALHNTFDLKDLFLKKELSDDIYPVDWIIELHRFVCAVEDDEDRALGDQLIRYLLKKCMLKDNEFCGNLVGEIIKEREDYCFVWIERLTSVDAMQTFESLFLRLSRGNVDWILTRLCKLFPKRAAEALERFAMRNSASVIPNLFICEFIDVLFPLLSPWIRSRFTVSSLFDQFVEFESKRLVLFKMMKSDRALALWCIAGVAEDLDDTFKFSEFFKNLEADHMPNVFSNLFGECVEHSCKFLSELLALDDYTDITTFRVWKLELLKTLIDLSRKVPRYFALLVLALTYMHGFEPFLVQTLQNLGKYELDIFFDLVVLGSDFPILSQSLFSTSCFKICEIFVFSAYEKDVLYEQHIVSLCNLLEETSIDAENLSFCLKILSNLVHLTFCSSICLRITDCGLKLYKIYLEIGNNFYDSKILSQYETILALLRKTLLVSCSYSVLSYEYILQKVIKQLEPTNLSDTDLSSWMNNQKRILFFEILNHQGIKKEQKNGVLVSSFLNELPSYYSRPSFEKYKKNLTLKHATFEVDLEISSRIKSMPFLLDIVRFLKEGTFLFFDLST
jgi:hypothetical protein